MLALDFDAAVFYRACLISDGKLKKDSQKEKEFKDQISKLKFAKMKADLIRQRKLL